MAVGAGVAIAESGGGGGAKLPPAARAAKAPQPRATHGSPSSLASVEAAGTAEIDRLAQSGLPVYCGGTRGDEVAFTFDDGPGVYTHFALKKLT